MSFNREVVSLFRDLGKWMKHLKDRINKMEVQLQGLTESGLSGRIDDLRKNTVLNYTELDKRTDECFNKLAERLDVNDQAIEAACKSIVKLEDHKNKPDSKPKADTKPAPDGWTVTFFMPVYTLGLDGKINNCPTITYKTEPYYNEDKDSDDEE